MRERQTDTHRERERERERDLLGTMSITGSEVSEVVKSKWSFIRRRMPRRLLEKRRTRY